MTPQQVTLIRAAGFAVALALAIALQAWAPHARLKGSWRTNTALWLIDGVLLAAICGACAYEAARWAQASGIGLLALHLLPLWVSGLVTLLALDVVSYAWHRANHRLRLLWRFHQVHHSDLAFTVSTGLRFHPGELLASLPIRLAAVVALGAPPEAVLSFEILFTIANLIEHGDINLPPVLERRLGSVFITPALHRFHHSHRWSDLNTNFGTILAIWDRLLGTYHDSSSACAVQTGLPSTAGPVALLQSLLLPARRFATRGRNV
jgi:sterol desaturase/sphingolipid hydroxylase (fatty acid hydroxylase superfamily)